MTVRVLVLSIVTLLVSVHHVFAGPVYTDRASWLTAVGGIVITEDFDGFPQNHSANPLPVAWGEVRAEFGDVFVHPFSPTGGLSLGAVNDFLIPTNAAAARGVALRVLGGPAQQVSVTITDGATVLLQRTVSGGTFFGWQRGPDETFARVVVTSLGGLTEIDDVEFALASPTETAILTFLDVPVSSRASQESVDELAATVATAAELNALAATVNALDAKVDGLGAASAALTTKVDALGTSATSLADALRNISNRLEALRRLIDDLHKDKDKDKDRGRR